MQSADFERKGDRHLSSLTHRNRGARRTDGTGEAAVKQQPKRGQTVAGSSGQERAEEERSKQRTHPHTRTWIETPTLRATSNNAWPCLSTPPHLILSDNIKKAAKDASRSGRAVHVCVGWAGQQCRVAAKEKWRSYPCSVCVRTSVCE